MLQFQFHCRFLTKTFKLIHIAPTQYTLCGCLDATIATVVATAVHLIAYVLRYSLCFAHNNSFEQGKFFFRLNLNVTKRWKRPKEVEKKTTVLGKVRSKSFNCDMVKLLLLCLPLETPTIVLTYERRRQALIVVKYLYLWQLDKVYRLLRGIT